MDCLPIHPNITRKLKQGSVTRVHNVRLNQETEALLERLKDYLKGSVETDIPSPSVIFRRALITYGKRTLALVGSALAEERHSLSVGTFLPERRKTIKTS